MKRKILAVVMMASITATPFANELAKLSYSTSATITPTVNKPVEIIATQAEKVSAADDISQQIFIAQTETPMLAVLSSSEMEETEGAHPLLVALLWMNAGVWGNHAISYQQTGQPASVSSTSVALVTSAVPAGRAFYGSKFGGEAAKTSYGTYVAWRDNSILTGAGIAASYSEHTPKVPYRAPSQPSRSEHPWRNKTWEDK